MFQFLQVKKDLEDANVYKNKIKETNKKLEDKVKELEEQLTKYKSKMKSLKVQLEQLRKAQKAKEIEEEGAKGKTEVRKKIVRCTLPNLSSFYTEYFSCNFCRTFIVLELR